MAVTQHPLHRSAPAPLLGQDSAAVLRDLGYFDDDITALQASGVTICATTA